MEIMTSRVKVLKRTITSKYKDIDDPKDIKLKQKKPPISSLQHKSKINNKENSYYKVDETPDRFAEYMKVDRSYDPLDLCDFDSNYKLSRDQQKFDEDSGILGSDFDPVSCGRKSIKSGSCCFCQKFQLLDLDKRIASSCPEMSPLGFSSEVRPPISRGRKLKSHSKKDHVNRLDHLSTNDWFDTHAIPVRIKLASQAQSDKQSLSEWTADSFLDSNLRCCCPVCELTSKKVISNDACSVSTCGCCGKELKDLSP